MSSRKHVHFIIFLFYNFSLSLVVLDEKKLKALRYLISFSGSRNKENWGFEPGSRQSL